MRVLLDGRSITTSGSTVQLTLRGRSSSSYTVEGLSIVQREGTTVNGVDSTWQAVTFGGQSSVTVPPNGSVTSDSIPFDLLAGQDVFVTFWVPVDQDPVYRTGGSQPMVWVVSGSNETGTVDWESLNPRSESSFNRVLYVVEQLAVTSGGNGARSPRHHRGPEFRHRDGSECRDLYRFGHRHTFAHLPMATGWAGYSQCDASQLHLALDDDRG